MDSSQWLCWTLHRSCLLSNTKMSHRLRRCLVLVVSTPIVCRQWQPSGEGRYKDAKMEIAVVALSPPLIGGVWSGSLGLAHGERGSASL